MNSIIPEYAVNNWHMFYLVCNSTEERNKLIEYFKKKMILVVFHYLSLHNSSFFKGIHDGRSLPNSDRFSECLLRLPLFYELDLNDLFSKLKNQYTCNY